MSIVIKKNQNAKDLLSTLVNQLWRFVSGPITMLLIPLYLTEVQQGYWYLFGSISALSVFADLGFQNIILQFSAHEFAYLNINNKDLLEGSKEHLSKLGSFLRFVIRWISLLCGIVFPIIYIIGCLFLFRDKTLNVYIIPWTIYSIGSLINFFNTSILSFIEGLNRIEKVQMIKFRVSLVNTLVIAFLLVFHWHIYALAIAMLVSSSTVFISIFGKFRKLLQQLLQESKDFIYDWKKEIIPLFLKYALSFSSGYFIFQIYTPLMHYFHGAELSGKVGISLSIITTLFNMSNIWMYTITPKINMLVSKKNWNELDNLFTKRLVFSIISYIFLGVLILLFVFILRNFCIVRKIIDRFLPLSSLTIIYCSYLFQLIINSMALYLRGHKKEPYVIPSVLSAVWIVTITFVAGKFLSSNLFFIGFLSSYFWCVPVCYIIFRKLRNKWHE